MSDCNKCGNCDECEDEYQRQKRAKQQAHSLHRLVSPLPCPFCGSTKITVEWEPCPKLDETDTTRRWFAECAQCSCQGPFCQKEPEVIPAWNKRANVKLTNPAAE